MLPVGPERAHVVPRRSLFPAYTITTRLGSGGRVNTIRLTMRQASYFLERHLPSHRSTRGRHFQRLHKMSAKFASGFRKRSLFSQRHLLLNVQVKHSHAMRADLSLTRAYAFSLLVQLSSLGWQ